MRIGRTAVALIALTAVALAAAGAEPQPMEILRQSILSRASVDFSGVRTVVVFSEGQKILGVEQKIDCDAPANLRIVFLAPDAERGKLCLTAGQDHWEFAPATGRAMHTQLPPPERVIAERLQEFDELAGEMRAQYVGIESIAGRQAHVVKVYTPGGLERLGAGSQLGFGLNWGRPNSTLFGTKLNDQYAAELYYRWQLADEIAITPGVQLLVNPPLNPDQDQVWVAAVRARIAF